MVSHFISLSCRLLENHPERMFGVGIIHIGFHLRRNPQSLKPSLQSKWLARLRTKAVQDIVRSRLNGAKRVWRFTQVYKYGDTEVFLLPFFTQLINLRYPDDWDPKSGPVKLKTLMMKMAG